MQAFSNSLVRNMVMYVNSQCSYITGNGCSKQPLGVHTLGLVPNNMITILQGCDYGLTKWEGIAVYTWRNAAGQNCCWQYLSSEGTSSESSYNIYNCPCSGSDIIQVQEDGTSKVWDQYCANKGMAMDNTSECTPSGSEKCPSCLTPVMACTCSGYTSETACKNASSTTTPCSWECVVPDATTCAT